MRCVIDFPRRVANSTPTSLSGNIKRNWCLMSHWLVSSQFLSCLLYCVCNVLNACPSFSTCSDPQAIHLIYIVNSNGVSVFGGVCVCCVYFVLRYGRIIAHSTVNWVCVSDHILLVWVALPYRKIDRLSGNYTPNSLTLQLMSHFKCILNYRSKVVWLVIVLLLTAHVTDYFDHKIFATHQNGQNGNDKSK